MKFKKSSKSFSKKSYNTESKKINLKQKSQINDPSWPRSKNRLEPLFPVFNSLFF